MVTSTNPGWIQTVFDTLAGIFGWVVGIFDWVGMQNIFKKTVGLVCHPFRVAGVWADETYTRRMAMEVRIYKER